MSKPQSEQGIFEQLVALADQPVNVGLRSTGEIISGKVDYTMFDSFIVETGAGRRVIRFDDILFLNVA